MKAVSPLIKNYKSETWAHTLALPCVCCVSQENSPHLSGPWLCWLALNGLWLDPCPSHLTITSNFLKFRNWAIHFSPSSPHTAPSSSLAQVYFQNISTITWVKGYWELLSYFCNFSLSLKLSPSFFFFPLSIPSTLVQTSITWVITFASTIVCCLFFCFNACSLPYLLHTEARRSLFGFCFFLFVFFLIFVKHA